MFLRSNTRSKDGKTHRYWSLVETVRTPSGPRQRTLCYLGELNDPEQTRWQKTIEVFNGHGESRQLALFASEARSIESDTEVAHVVVSRVRLERSRQFGNCFLGLELWKRLELDRFFEGLIDESRADVAWSRIAAVLAINRLCDPGSELAIEQRWYPATALDDLLGIEDGKVDAATLFEPQYRYLVDRGRLDHAAYRTLWRSRPYSHCGFAARPGLPAETSHQFVDLLTSMDYGSPDIKEMMDLEGLRAWVPADESGWQDLIAAVKEEDLVGHAF